MRNSIYKISCVSALLMILLCVTACNKEKFSEDNTQEKARSSMDKISGTYVFPEEYEGMTSFEFLDDNKVLCCQQGYYKLEIDGEDKQLYMNFNDNFEGAIPYSVNKQGECYNMKMKAGEEDAILNLNFVSGTDVFEDMTAPDNGEYVDMDHDNIKYIFKDDSTYQVEMLSDYQIEGENLLLGDTQYTYEFDNKKGNLILHSNGGDIILTKKEVKK